MVFHHRHLCNGFQTYAKAFLYDTCLQFSPSTLARYIRQKTLSVPSLPLVLRSGIGIAACLYKSETPARFSQFRQQLPRKLNWTTNWKLTCFIYISEETRLDRGSDWLNTCLSLALMIRTAGFLNHIDRWQFTGLIYVACCQLH